MVCMTDLKQLYRKKHHRNITKTKATHIQPSDCSRTDTENSAVMTELKTSTRKDKSGEWLLGMESVQMCIRSSPDGTGQPPHLIG